jgi:DNA (cytosine-5)-methyltransferase 1
MKCVAIDLFCGVGGLTFGLQQAGIPVIAGIDIDGTCKYAYEANNNSIFINKSIEDVSIEEVKQLYPDDTIKILVGCAPCQPFTNFQRDKKNKKKHKDWGLLHEFLRLIDGVEPEIISMENVPMLLKEEIFSLFVKELKKMKYFINFKILDAQNYGVPQRRNRLVLIASKFDKIIFPDIQYDKVTVRNAIGNLPKIQSGEKCKIDSIHTSSKLKANNLERIKCSLPGKTWDLWPKKLLPKCYQRKSGTTYKSVYGRMSWDDVAPTLTTQFYNYGTGRYGHPEQDRAISLREGAILQSFPSQYLFSKNDGEIKITEVARQIGNAVPPKLAEYIGKVIITNLNKIN